MRPRVWIKDRIYRAAWPMYTCKFCRGQKLGTYCSCACSGYAAPRVPASSWHLFLRWLWRKI